MKRKETVNFHVNIMRPHSPVLLPKQYDFFHRKLMELKRQFFSLLWKKASSVSELISVVEE
jgi:hypothetical protein